MWERKRQYFDWAKQVVDGLSGSESEPQSRIRSCLRPVRRARTFVKLALIGFGNVGRALARLVWDRRAQFPFRITGIHTARHGTARSEEGLSPDPVLAGPRLRWSRFLMPRTPMWRWNCTSLNPSTGEPAIAHIRAAFARGMHVVTANKGPIAHAYAALREEAIRRGLGFRFESTVMDGTPVFNLVRNNLPGVRVLGFTGVLNSTSKIVVEAMERGSSFAEGLEMARSLGITEADGAYDVEGWDSAAKTAALANVLMDAGVTPQAVSTRGIGRLTPPRSRTSLARGKLYGWLAARDGIRRVSRCACAPRSSRRRIFWLR